MSDKRTKEIVAEMLKTDVGRSLLDSGGYPCYDENGNYTGSSHGYGRAFERNRNRDFEKEPVSQVRFRAFTYEGKTQLDVEYTRSVYHYLVETAGLEYEEDLDKLFQEFSNKSREAYLQDAELFCDYLEKYLLFKAGLIRLLSDEEYDVPEEYQTYRAYDDSTDTDVFTLCEQYLKYEEVEIDLEAERVRAQIQENLSDAEEMLLDEVHSGGVEPQYSENTYNGEENLSQVLQYVVVEINDAPYIMLQVHGGADVRGGYTRPYIFSMAGEPYLPNAAAGTLYLKDCSEEEAEEAGLPRFWDTDDSYHWYPEGCCGMGYRELSEYPVIDGDTLEDIKELPQDLKEMEEAIVKAPFHLRRMCEIFPDREERYKKESAENLAALEKEFEAALLNLWRENGDIPEDVILVRDGRAFLKGFEIVAG